MDKIRVGIGHVAGVGQSADQFPDMLISNQVIPRRVCRTRNKVWTSVRTLNGPEISHLSECIGRSLYMLVRDTRFALSNEIAPLQLSQGSVCCFPHGA